MRERTLQGALTLLGFVVSLLAVIYFGATYLPQVSDGTRLAALVLLALAFAYLAVYIRATTVGAPFFEGELVAWLRPAALIIACAVVCGIVAEMVFLAMEGVPKPLKILVSLLVGVGLIVGVARWRTRAATSHP